MVWSVVRVPITDPGTSSASEDGKESIRLRLSTKSPPPKSVHSWRRVQAVDIETTLLRQVDRARATPRPFTPPPKVLTNRPDPRQEALVPATAAQHLGAAPVEDRDRQGSISSPAGAIRRPTRRTARRSDQDPQRQPGRRYGADKHLSGSRGQQDRDA